MSTTTQFSPQLRPLSVGEILDAAFKVVRQSFATLVVCVLVVALPLNIVNTLITASTSDDAFSLEATTSTEPASTGTQLAGTLLAGTLGLVLTTLAAAACFRAVSAAYLGEQPTVSESLGFASKRVLPLIWLSILYFIGLIPAFIALIIPGIWLSVAWSLSYPALLHEDCRGAKALGRSFRLVRGRWWPTFGALLVMYLIVVVISGILGVLFGATLIAATDNQAVAGIFYTIANTLSSMVTLPLVAAVLTIIYFDLRVRKEGFDLQLLAQGVGQSAARPTSPGYGETSPEAVAAASGLGGSPPTSSAPPPSGGFAPPEAPSQAPSPSEPAPPSGPAPSEPPSTEGGLQSGDPLGSPPPERRDDGGGPAT